MYDIVFVTVKQGGSARQKINKLQKVPLMYAELKRTSQQSTQKPKNMQINPLKSAR